MDLNELKQKATELRLEGKTYKQISEHLDGALSVDWCKRNLKGVKANTEKEDEQALAEIIKLATRPEGCTNYELRGVLFKHLTEKQLRGQYMTAYKKKAKYRNPDCLFRPGWVSTQLPKHSENLLYSMASDLFERINESVQDFTQTFPETDRKAVWMELVKLSNGFLNPEGLDKRLERNRIVVMEMEERKTNQ